MSYQITFYFLMDVFIKRFKLFDDEIEIVCEIN